MSQSPSNLVCKWVWPSLFKYAYERTFTKHNITKGFSACGIYPPDKSAIPDNAFMPSNAFDTFTSEMDTAAFSNALDESASNRDQEHPMQKNEMVNEPKSQLEERNPYDELDAELLGTADDSGTLTLESVTAAEVLDAIMRSEMNVNAEGSGILQESNEHTIEPHNFTIMESPTSSIGQAPDNVGQIPTPELLQDTHTISVKVTSPSEEIDRIFALPKPITSVGKSSKRKLTSRRLLTSDEIVREKMEIKKKKEEEALKKEERKLARLMKQAMKENIKPIRKRLI
ncbi:uncharacterized protein LOC123539890 [Mercenaria mercenaria]|uniref:uncharacterized protein LOC123539890 n=1 Tax=Mercenaria mercenaria TaxID=6596 RepID=UPI00234E6111|nr:uncharacterized protein LOC123539890 [Mercenaria mercenaria]